MPPFDSKMAYVVTHLFLEKTWQRTNYEALGALSGEMSLLDAERSMDPGLVFDWAKATNGKATFTKQEGFEAAKAFLRYWYNIGPQDEIKSVVDSMETSPVAELWDACWNEVSANMEAGEPFKTAFAYGSNAQGKPGRFSRNPVTGFHEFIED